MATTNMLDKQINSIGEEEGWAILDRAARQHLGMSAEEFVQAWTAGQLQDPDAPNVQRVAMLLPLAR